MNKKEILGLCEFLKLHGYENTDNISRFIFELQQENKQLKERSAKALKYIEKMFNTGFYNDDYCLGKLNQILQEKEVSE